jgi:thioredoxin reductase (NADPH)
METEKLVIIGSGPAGWTAAIYAARANLSPLVYIGAPTYENQIAGTLPLGQLNLTTEVENFPGFPHGIQGPKLMLNMQEQAERFGTRVVMRDIVDVHIPSATERLTTPFTLTDSDGEKIQTKAIILATGASAKYPDLPAVEKFRNRGVSACAVCDGALPRFNNQVVAVVGGGDSACEEANYLTKYASRVLLIHRRDVLRASEIMARRALSNPKVIPHWNAEVEDILGDDDNGVTGLKVKYTRPEGDFYYVTVGVSGVFFAIGHAPNTKFLRTYVSGVESHSETGVAINNGGFIVTGESGSGWIKEFATATSVEGIFAAGDVADPKYKQAITAAGSGCKAALDAERWLALQGVH